MRHRPQPARLRRALPRRFRRARLLIVGCGDVGMRLLAQLAPRMPQSLDALALSRNPAQRASARALGARALTADLDQRRSLRRLAAFSDSLIYLAPPPAQGCDDPRIARLIAACRAHLWRRARSGAPLARWTYVSTSGVYGNCDGALVEESRPVAPASERARRRVAAERRVRTLSRSGLARVAILRAPGIYAHDRLPLQRLRAGTPVLSAQDDVYTNHVHAEDLARVAWLALARGRPGRVYHAVDNSMLKMGEYFELLARTLDLPAPPRVARAAIGDQVSPAMLSFMIESRRLDNRRLLRELRYRLRWPSVADSLSRLAADRVPGAADRAPGAAPPAGLAAAAASPNEPETL